MAAFALLTSTSLPTARAAAPPGVTPFWQAVANCETGGLWDWGRFAGTPRQRKDEGTAYEGGVGFRASTWRSWAAHLRVPFAHAWQAPPAAQVRVARYGLSVGGFWGCLHGASHAWILALPGR